MNKRLQASIAIVAIVIVCIAGYLLLKPGEESYRSIKVEQTEGEVSLIRKQTSTSLAEKMMLYDQDAVSTFVNSYSVLLLDADKFIYVEENTKFHVEATGTEKNSKTRIYLDEGAITSEIQQSLHDNSYYEIQTPNSIMAVRGTAFRVAVETIDGEVYTSLDVLEGEMCSYILDENGAISQEVKVPAGYHVEVRFSDAQAEYVLTNNEILTEAKYEELPLQALRSLLTIEQHDVKQLGISKETLQRLIEEKTTPKEPDVVEPPKQEEEKESIVTPDEPKQEEVAVETPKTPIINETPTIPPKQEEPSKPEVPVVPEEPVVPEKPVVPEEPVVPEQPQQPTQPETPEQPDTGKTVYYTVTLKVDGNPYQEVKVKEREKTTLPDLTKQGYIFKGWETSEHVMVEKEYQPVTDIVLTPVFTPRTDTGYTIHYFVKEKQESTYTEVTAKQKIRSGTTDTTIVPDVEDAFSYNGNNAILQTPEKVTILADGSASVNVYYIYELPKSDEIQITFVFADDRQAETRTYSKSSIIQEFPTSSSKEGYHTIGWNTKLDGTGENIIDNYVISTNLVVYEQMTLDYVPYTIEYYYLDTDTKDINNDQTIEWIPYRTINGTGQTGTNLTYDAIVDRPVGYELYMSTLSAPIEKDMKYLVFYMEQDYISMKFTTIFQNEQTTTTKTKYLSANQYFYGLKNHGMYASWYSNVNQQRVDLPFGTIITKQDEKELLSDFSKESQSRRKLSLTISKQNYVDDSFPTETYQMYIDTSHDFTLPKNKYLGYREAEGANVCEFTKLAVDDICTLTFTYKREKTTLTMDMNVSTPKTETLTSSQHMAPVPSDYQVTKENYHFLGWRINNTDIIATGFYGGGQYQLEAVWEHN